MTNFWKGNATDVPNENLEIPTGAWDTFCEEYDDRCPSNRPQTMKDLEKCSSDECDDALESLWWRCHHAESAQGAASKLPGSWDETSTNVCYGVQKAAYSTGIIQSG